MLDMGFTLNPRQLQWWPEEAHFAADFTARRFMRSGQPISGHAAITFERASAKLAPNDTGIFHEVAPDQPAWSRQGLNLESAATNLVPDNEGTTSTQVSGVNVNPWQGPEPAVAGTARNVVQDTTTFASIQRTGLSVTKGNKYTASQFFHHDGATSWIVFYLSDGVSSVKGVWLNLETMRLGSGYGSPDSVRLDAYGNGWHRLMVTGDLSNTTADARLISFATTGNGSTTRQSGSYGIWGAQVEAGLVATSPILTHGSGGTRASDNLSLHLPETRGDLTLTFASGDQILASQSGDVALAPPPTPLHLRAAICMAT